MIRQPLTFPPGLYADDSKFSMPFRCVAADCVRWDRGKAQPIGGWNSYTTTALTGVCRNVLPWTDLAGYANIAFGTHSALQVLVGGTLYTITPSGLAAGSIDGAGGPGFGAGAFGAGVFGGASVTDYFPRTWSLDNWGQNLMASPRMCGLYIWDNNTASLATIISTAPAQISSMIVVAQRQVLAGGCNEESSGVFNPLCIRGSNIEDYTDWTSLASNNAFELILEGGGSRIVALKEIGPYVAAFTDKGVHLGQFIGDTGQVWRFDLISADCGLIGPNAVQIVNQTAYWVTPDYQFYAWTIGAAPQLLPCPVRDDFKDSVATGQYEKIAATSVGQFGEVWWFYPHTDDGLECSRYVSVQAIPGQPLIWSAGTLARSACVDSGPTAHPIFVSPTGYVYSHEDGQTADGSALSWSFTVELPYLDEGGRFVMVKGIEPDIKDQVGAVSVSFEMKKYPQSDPRSYGPYTLAANATRKHFMFSGRSGTVTFEGSSSPSFARFGKPILLGEATGQE